MGQELIQGQDVLLSCYYVRGDQGPYLALYCTTTEGTILPMAARVG